MEMGRPPLPGDAIDCVTPIPPQPARSTLVVTFTDATLSPMPLYIHRTSDDRSTLVVTFTDATLSLYIHPASADE